MFRSSTCQRWYGMVLMALLAPGVALADQASMGVGAYVIGKPMPAEHYPRLPGGTLLGQDAWLLPGSPTRVRAALQARYPGWKWDAFEDTDAAWRAFAHDPARRCVRVSVRPYASATRLRVSSCRPATPVAPATPPPVPQAQA